MNAKQAIIYLNAALARKAEIEGKLAKPHMYRESYDQWLRLNDTNNKYIEMYQRIIDNQ